MPRTSSDTHAAIQPHLPAQVLLLTPVLRVSYCCQPSSTGTTEPSVCLQTAEQSSAVFPQVNRRSDVSSSQAAC